MSLSFLDFHFQITHEMLAIKTCIVTLSAKNRPRWRDEISMMRENQHSNLVGYRDIPPKLIAQINSPEQCLGMEYCEGGDLRRVRI